MRLPQLKKNNEKMNSLEIKNILSHDRVTKKYFLDVFPSDQLPVRIVHYPACFVCNVDSSTESGSHWLAFFLSSPDEGEFFDSYGNVPRYFKGPISEFASRYSRMNYNPLILQSSITAVCGQYCVYYLYSRCRGQTLQKILSNFVTKNVCNDRLVYNFVAKRFGVYVNFYQ